MHRPSSWVHWLVGNPPAPEDIGGDPRSEQIQLAGKSLLKITLHLRLDPTARGHLAEV